MSNLLSNAIKYGAGKGIGVELDALEDRVRLVVRDRGIGIEHDSQRRIFERFERAASSRHYGGFGLGLWITRQVVEASGGIDHRRERARPGFDLLRLSASSLTICLVAEARRDLAGTGRRRAPGEVAASELRQPQFVMKAIAVSAAAAVLLGAPAIHAQPASSEAPERPSAPSPQSAPAQSATPAGTGAQPSAPALPAGAPGAAAAVPGPRPLFAGVHLGAYALVTDLPAVLFGVTAGSLVLAAGFQVKYDGNGLMNPATNVRSSEHVSAGVITSVSYMFYNTYPVAFGPVATYTMTLAPGSVFDTQIVTGGAEFFFAPFPVPMVVGANLLMRMTLVANQKAVVDAFTPALVFGFKID